MRPGYSPEQVTHLQLLLNLMFATSVSLYEPAEVCARGTAHFAAASERSEQRVVPADINFLELAIDCAANWVIA